MLTLPYFKQSTPYTCGPATLRSVLAFYSIEKSEKELEKDLKTLEEKGTEREAMIQEAEKAGLTVASKFGGTHEELLEYLQKGIPVIVRFVESGDDEHYAVVIGGDETSIILSDPYHGVRVDYRRHEFEGRWNMKDARRWFMAVSKKEA